MNKETPSPVRHLAQDLIRPAVGFAAVNCCSAGRTVEVLVQTAAASRCFNSGDRATTRRSPVSRGVRGL
jgi:hypothetical protein